MSALSIPVDAQASAALAARGLSMVVVDPDDADQVRAWVEADSRGFHEAAPTDEFVAEVRQDFPLQRTVGVYDDSLADPSIPIATTTSWPSALTVQGGELGAWAISGVTVAPTHRRRGIARSMLESELRVAVEAELPVAMLTVSEATIYGRYGFAPAAWSTDIAIDARRAGWIGAATPGRVQLVGRDTAMRTGRAVFDDARRSTPGDVEVVDRRWARLFGAPEDPAEQRKQRFARFDDEHGVPRGVAIYSLVSHPTDFARHTVQVGHLFASTDDAYRALWRFVLEIDLVETVTATLRSTDEPLRWLVRDPRMIRTTELREHLWVRVLDPVLAFGARTYSGAGRLTLRVADPLGYADGAITIEADAAGRAVVTAGEAQAGPALDLPIELLGTLLLGGVATTTLAAAGRLTERAPGDAAAADRLLRAARAPMLTTWF